jgi:hypothetical protein
MRHMRSKGRAFVLSLLFFMFLLSKFPVQTVRESSRNVDRGTPFLAE